MCCVRLRYYLLLLIFSVSLVSCGGSGGENTSPASVQPPLPTSFAYQTPSARSDGWDVTSAQDLGMDVALLETMMEKIYANEFGFRRMDGVLIVKDNRLIFDALIRTRLDMTDSWTANTDLNLHSVHSVTKSVMSLSMGVAIEQGLVGSVDDFALDYFSDYAPFGEQGETKATMTIDNWLTMQHGFLWDEWNVNYQNSENQNLQMINAADPLTFLFQQPVASEPGSQYAYSTGVSYALGEIIARSSEMTLLQFMQLNLFQPLGIHLVDFWDFHGDVHGGSGLYLTMRDMAKLGQLLLNKGQWQGQQVVSSQWIETSTKLKVQEGNIRYAYQWWINDLVGPSDFQPSVPRFFDKLQAFQFGSIFKSYLQTTLQLKRCRAIN